MSKPTGPEPLHRVQAIIRVVSNAQQWAALLHAARWYDQVKGTASLTWQKPFEEWEGFLARAWAEWCYAGRPEIPPDMRGPCRDTLAIAVSTEHTSERCTHEHVHIARLEEA